MSNGTNPPVNIINKVNSSEFDPLQEKGQASGEPTRKESTASINSSGSNPEVPDNRPRSVPVNQPVPGGPQSTVVTVQNPHYSRTPTTGYSFRSIPYPQQQYSAYSTAG